jgi:hypothetical protein
MVWRDQTKGGEHVEGERESELFEIVLIIFIDSETRVTVCHQWDMPLTTEWMAALLSSVQVKTQVKKAAIYPLFETNPSVASCHPNPGSKNSTQLLTPWCMHHASEKRKGIRAEESHGSDSLPAAVTKRGAVSAAPATTSTAAATTTATAPATTATTATAAATTVANHLSETGVNLLLGLTKNVDEVTSLLGVWDSCQ